MAGRAKLALSVALCAAVSMAFSASAQAYSVHFGCASGDRAIAATAYYSASGSYHWYVDYIGYSYTNSGGGKTDTYFYVYNGTNALAWQWHTPDDRTNRSYTKSVATTISRGNYARAKQTTYFDVFGSDPSCTKSGNF